MLINLAQVKRGSLVHLALLANQVPREGKVVLASVILLRGLEGLVEKEVMDMKSNQAELEALVELEGTALIV